MSEATLKPEPVKVQVVRYDCPFCRSGFRSSKKSNVVEHMPRCWSDPANKTCRTCAFHVRPSSGDAEYCRQDVDLPDRAPVVSCPLWRDRDEDEDGAS